MSPYHHNDELYHYGVKGMKWGVRRYLNRDGSLTEAGKKRYRNANSDIMSRDTYSLNELKALPGKERRATKKYLRDYKKNYKQNAKRQYKALGKRRGLKKLEVSEDGTVRNRKTGEKVDTENYIKAMQHMNIYAPEFKQKITSGSAYVASSAVLALSMAAFLSTMTRYR